MSTVPGEHVNFIVLRPSALVTDIAFDQSTVSSATDCYRAEVASFPCIVEQNV